MSIERLAATPPLTRREAGLWIINYILEYEERRIKSLRMAKYSINGTTLDGGCHVVDPMIADTETSLVNAWLLGIRGIDATVEKRGSPLTVELMEWHGPDPTDPRRHNWTPYPPGSWEIYQHNSVPKPDPLSIDLEALHQKVQQSLQP